MTGGESFTAGGTVNRPRQPRLSTVLEVIVTAAVVAGAGFLFWHFSTPRSGPVVSGAAVGANADSQSLDSRLVMGKLDAPAVVVVISDFQCPFCARFAATTLPEIKRVFVDTGRTSLYFRHFPLEGHLMAKPAAELAECAAQNGNFWPAHDALFAANTQLNAALFDRVALSVGLERWKPGFCPVGNVKSALAADADWALRMGMTGTPFVLFGRRNADGRVQFRSSLAGARSISELTRAIDALGAATR